jgi:pimeloyl-ACP methyl ester carboxylesterase
MLKSKLVRFAWRAFQFLAVLYVGILILLFFMQRKMIYQPARDSQEVMAKMAQEHDFEAWQNASGQFIGWKHISRLKREHGKLLIVHGNAGCAIDRTEYTDGLQTIEPMDVYILEYPGYGARGGEPSEQSLFAAASEGMDLLKGTAPVYVMGESLGTGVACYLAGTYPDVVRGVLLIAPYENFTDVAKVHMPPIIPVSLLLRDHFMSGKYLTKYHGPVAMRFAGLDVIVPNRFGHKLYDGYQGPKKFWEVPTAGHNDLLHQDEGWWRDVAEFWKANAPATP